MKPKRYCQEHDKELFDRSGTGQPFEKCYPHKRPYRGIDIVKPLGWERSGSAMTDTDMKYLELYLEENYQLTSEKKIDDAIRIVANENKYHPICDF